ncbi:MAG: MDR family MFS transporter [Anaerolineae bacterium]
MARLQSGFGQFPRPFWVLFFGSIINSMGGGLVYPFLSIYLRQRLEIPMTTVGVIISLWSLAAFPAQLVGGSLADRLGRRSMMVFSLLASGATTLGFGLAPNFAIFTVLAILAGSTSPLYGPAANAMLADLVGPARRPRAFGLLRIASNLGFAMGPALGGFIAGRSYLLLFTLGALTSLIYALIVFLGTYETRPEAVEPAQGREGAQGFSHILRNRPFLVFSALAVVSSLLYAQMTLILPVHMKEDYGLPEHYYGWVMTSNAGLVAVLQYAVTRWAERWPRLRMMALGSTLYALGVGSVSLARGFPWFVASMVTVTFGEMINIPVSNSVAADMAPPELRGRYMGVFGLTWSLGFAVGPVMGGAISDQLGVAFLWPSMCAMGLVAAGGFLLLERAVGATFRVPSAEKPAEFPPSS